MKEGEGRPTERFVTIKEKHERHKGFGAKPQFFFEKMGLMKHPFKGHFFFETHPEYSGHRAHSFTH